MNPWPLRCERNDLPLIYEPFKERNYIKMIYPGIFAGSFFCLEAIDFKNLDVFDAWDFCECLFYSFGSTFSVINN